MIKYLVRKKNKETNESNLKDNGIVLTAPLRIQEEEDLEQEYKVDGCNISVIRKQRDECRFFAYFLLFYILYHSS